jgi:hypothetical protein
MLKVKKCFWGNNALCTQNNLLIHIIKKATH